MGRRGEGRRRIRRDGGLLRARGLARLRARWVLARRWWGRGYATEAARAALDHAFAEWRRDRVISLVDPQNQASIRVAERIGEVLQGRIEHNGREMLRYAIDREAHETRRQERAMASAGEADSGPVSF